MAYYNCGSTMTQYNGVKDALTSSESYSLTVFAISLQRTDELNVVPIGTLRSLTKLTSYDAKIGV